MNDLSAWLRDVAELAGQALLALTAIVHLLDWLDTIFPSLLPYTSWLTDPLGTVTGGKRERYAHHDEQER